jgi:O-antigen ligase
VNFVYLFLFAAAWVVIQCLIGGTRLLFSLPAYGLLAIAAIFTLASVRTRRIPPSVFCVASTLLLGAWVLVRSSHSPVEYLALPDFYMMIGCLTAYLLTAYHLTSQRDRTVLVGVLWALAGLEVWCGLIQFLKDQKFMLFGLLRSQNVERASGLFISPNHFAGFLEAVAILSLSMAVWSRWPVWAKLLGGYVALSCWLGVAISGSRGGYFSTIITLVVFSIGSIYTIRLVDPRKFTAALVCSLGAVAIMVAVAAFLMGHSELLTHRMDTMVAKDNRIYNWEAALDHIRVSPWTGTGAGTHLIYGRMFRRPQIQADPVHAHCDYLELIAEYGVVGGVCMVLFAGFHVWNGLDAYFELLHRRLLPSGIARSNSFAMNLGALCAVAGLAAHSVVDFNMHIPGNALVFAFIFGMLANPGVERPTNFVESRVLPWGRLLLPGLGVWMIWAGLPLLPSEWIAEQAREALRDNKYLDAIDYADLALGRSEGHATRSDASEFEIMGRPWTSYFGGIAGLLDRFGRNLRNPDVYFYLGEANRGLGSRMPLDILKRHYFEAAIPAFRDGLKVFPQDENALIRLAQCLDGTRRYQEAEEVYQELFKIDPHLGILYGCYATHLQAQGRKMEADAASRTEEDLDKGEVDSEKKAANVVQ